MGRHNNPRYNRKRLAAAGIAAVTMLGVAVGVGVYGSALADQPAPVARQECLPPGDETTAPPTEPTPPGDTATDQPTEPPTGQPTEPPTEPPTDQPTEPPTDQPTDQPTEPPTEQPTEEPAEPPAGYGAEAPQEGQPRNLANPAISLNGDDDAQDGSDTDYGGPKPPDQPPAPPADAPMRDFGAPDCTDRLGPVASDFVDIRRVRPVNRDPRPGRGASTGSFVSECGTNENNHNNPANFIVAPGDANGAHHLHDYVGNLSTDGDSTNESLLAAGTTCRLGDKSTYYWPVIRVRGRDAPADETNPHNVGTVRKPSAVTLRFSGNARSKVVAMPDFIRIITGDAKAFSNGGANQNSAWGCTGFRNRVTTKYPLCPRRSQVTRTLVFPSCWDGQNTDSANHRDHVAFPDRRGACPRGTRAIPKLTMTLAYDLPRGKVFALDAFEDQRHSPITDHGDFVNVMPSQLMNRAVQCINTGRRC